MKEEKLNPKNIENTVKKIAWRKFFQIIKADSSTWILILSNILTIFIAIIQNGEIPKIMFLYWAQSVIIGFFTFFKIISLRELSTKNFKLNDRNVKPTNFTKYYAAFFFLIHYGGFHTGYLLILMLEFQVKLNSLYLLIPAGIFLVNHLFSFIYNYKADSKKVRNIGSIMFFPYARIIPMHLTIIFGSLLIKDTFTLIFFLGLKTIADVIMHLIEHSEE